MLQQFQSQYTEDSSSVVSEDSSVESRLDSKSHVSAKSGLSCKKIVFLTILFLLLATVVAAFGFSRFQKSQKSVTVSQDAQAVENVEAESIFEEAQLLDADLVNGESLEETASDHAESQQESPSTIEETPIFQTENEQHPATEAALVPADAEQELPEVFHELKTGLAKSRLPPLVQKLAKPFENAFAVAMSLLILAENVPGLVSVLDCQGLESIHTIKLLRDMYFRYTFWVNLIPVLKRHWAFLRSVSKECLGSQGTGKKCRAVLFSSEGPDLLIADMVMVFYAQRELRDGLFWKNGRSISETKTALVKSYTDLNGWHNNRLNWLGNTCAEYKKKDAGAFASSLAGMARKSRKEQALDGAKNLVNLALY
jgi:hypothetical protein